MSSPEAGTFPECVIGRVRRKAFAKLRRAKDPARGVPRSYGTSIFECLACAVAQEEPRDTDAVNLGKSRVALPYLNGINGAKKFRNF